MVPCARIQDAIFWQVSFPHSIFAAVKRIPDHLEGKQPAWVEPLIGKIPPPPVLLFDFRELPSINPLLEHINVSSRFFEFAKPSVVNQLVAIHPKGNPRRNNLIGVKDAIGKTARYAQKKNCPGRITEDINHVEHALKIGWTT